LYPTSSTEKPKEYTGFMGVVRALQDKAIEISLKHVAGKKEEEMAHPKWWVAILCLVATCYVVSHFLLRWILGSSQSWGDVPDDLSNRKKDSITVLGSCHDIKFSIERTRKRLVMFKSDYRKMLIDIKSIVKTSVGYGLKVDSLNHIDFLEFLSSRSLAHTVKNFQAHHIDRRAFVRSLTPDDMKTLLGIDSSLDISRLAELQDAAKKGLLHRPHLARAIKSLSKFLDDVITEADQIKVELEATWNHFYTSSVQH